MGVRDWFVGGKNRKGALRKEPVFRARGKRFEGAKTDYLSGWNTGDYQTINARLFNDLEALRARSREAARDNPFAKRFLELAQRNIVGTGFVCRPKSGNKELDNAVLRALEVHSRRENFTAQGNMSRAMLENLAVVSLFRDGEFIAQKVRKRGGGYYIRPLDPAQLFTQFTGTYYQSGAVFNNSPGTGARNGDNGNRIILGVEVDANYRAVAYHFYSNNPARNSGVVFAYKAGDIIRVPASQIIHLFVPQYVNQVRGIPHLHAALLQMESQKRYDETAQDAARKGASLVTTLKSNDGESGLTGEAPNSNNDRELNMEGDELFQLNQNEELQTHSFDYPHQQYGPYTDKVNERMAAGLDTSAPLLTQNFGNANFSSSQLMYFDDRDNWKRWQKFFADTFHPWWYDEWIVGAILRGEVVMPNGETVLAASYELLKSPQWLGKQFPPVDIAKFASATNALLQAGVKSPQQVIREMGDDPEEVAAEIEEWQARFPQKAPNSPVSPPNSPENGEDGGEAQDGEENAENGDSDGEGE